MSQNTENKNQITDTNDVMDSDKYTNKVKKSKSKSLGSKKGKIIASLLFMTMVGIGGGFYAGTEYGRTLPATHRKYSKSQVLATIGDVKITGKDLSKKMEPYFYSQGLKKLSDEDIETQETNTLNYITNLEVLYKAGVDSGIKVTDDEIDENYSKTMSSIESTFNLTESEYLNKFHLTKDEFKEGLKKELIATTYLQDNSNVSEDEAKNYYNNNKEDFFKIRASHILISNYDEDGKELSDKKKAENKELAEKLLKRAQNGESFDDLALEYSDDSYTSSKGGDLGYFGQGKMDDNFEEAAFSLKNNQIYSKVVETSYGYHIIKKTGEQYSDFDDEKDGLVETLTNNKQNTLLQDALEKYNAKINM
ncbi:peptidylprolyl isomerase [Terrisporobacter sp.]